MWTRHGNKQIQPYLYPTLRDPIIAMNSCDHDIIADDEYPSGGTAPKSTPGDPAGVTAIVSQPQLMILPTPVSYKQDDIAPHSFLALVIIVAIFFGFISILTLTCSIPAVILSCIVREFLYPVYVFLLTVAIQNHHNFFLY